MQKTATMPPKAARRQGFDLLRLPLVGPFLRWRHARAALQIPLLLLAALLLYDGFWGPQLAPKNMAGVLPWVHWRGFLVLGLLVGGNLFSMACPFMLPRKLAKRLLPGQWSWPRPLRSKWLALVLLLLFLWAYEAFNLWASPLLTAWVALAYFAGAFVIEGFFKGAAFCKYVCPIGQFNFVNSLASPLEVKARNLTTCASCVTKDCIAGRQPAPPATRPAAALALTDAAAYRATRGQAALNGCELWLFQEKKVGNMDCTFCLDCVHACPHDNVGIMARVPGSELWNDARRSGVGRLSERTDLAALALVLVFGALLNAFAMTAPAYPIEDGLAGLLGTDSKPLVTLLLFGPGLVILPLGLVALTALASRALAGGRATLPAWATRYSFALVPFGFAMWAAHYLYHFLTGALTIIPVTQDFLLSFGIGFLGQPQWSLSQLLPLDMVFPLELMLLDVGLLGSLLVGYRIARAQLKHTALAWRAFLPWGLLTVLLFIFAVWVLLQPMEMRGTLFGAG